MAEVLYRKWRPQSFAEVAGQDAITRTLRNSVASGKLAHAYLFCGPRGTGKTTLGRLLAKAANCAAPVDGEPCNKCDSCVSFIEGRAMDFVEQDAASHNGVDDVRQLRENVILSPMAGGRKVHLLDEVHMLSKAAQNALLKTLEEPPAHLIFVLATTEPHKVESTIISRCQRFDLKRIPMSAAVERLGYISKQEGFSLDKSSLEEIARAATGSLRDGVNGLEQVVTYYGKSPSNDQVREALGLSVDARSGLLARSAMAGDLARGLTIISDVRNEGADIKHFAKQVVVYIRGLLLAKAGASESLDLPQDMAAEVKADAANLSRSEIIRALQTFGRIDFREDAAASGGSLPLELALVEFVSTMDDQTPVGAARERPSQTPASAPTPAKPTSNIAPTTSARPEVLEGPAKPASTASAQTPRASAQPARPTQTAHPEGVEGHRSKSPDEAPLPPAREAAAPETSGAASHSMSAADSEALLARARAFLHESERQLEGLLNGSCEIKSSEGDRVVLGFFHTFHLERIEKGPYKEKLQEAFSSVLGRPIKIVYEHSPQERSTGPRRQGGHLVEAAREMGARTSQPEPEPEPEP
ncbi:MAG: DNA polymerase III subunit gamma/tau [Chloroflexota bacterium]